MAVKVANNGTWSAEYNDFSGGLNIEQPETNIPDNCSPSTNGFMIRNNELRSWPALTAYNNAGLPGSSLFGVTTFLDANGFYHCVTWTGNTGQGTGLYQYQPTIPNWVLVGNASPGLLNSILSYRAFANILYYTSSGIVGGGGSGGRPVVSPFLGYWDGIAANPVYTQAFSDASVSISYAGISKTDSPAVGGSLPGAPVIVGPIAIGGAYIGELNNQIILANITIADNGNANKLYNFPNMIWWSANGLPGVWDPEVNPSAGFNPFLDVADQITGLATLGVAAYIFRNYGITQMAPTGSESAPWEFDHMWASEHGIGNAYPWSISQYGPTCAFIAQDNIYTLSIANASPIGGKARDAIMADIANSTGTPFANIIPILQNGFVYLTYQVWIPFATFMRQYTYSFEDQNWTPRDMALPQISGTQQMFGPGNVV